MSEIVSGYRWKRWIIPFLLYAGSLVLVYALRPRSPLLDGSLFSSAYYDRNGVLLKVYPAEDGRYRIFRPLNDFPSRWIEAVLLQEDRYFYRHGGVNPVSLIRAARETYFVRDRKIGASTITMQLARLRFGIRTNTVAGKLRQILAAQYLELYYSKQEILEAYMNLVPCGGSIEGFPAASYIYFDRPAGDLEPAEWMTLCVIPQDPVNRDPRFKKNREEILQARARLFDRWVSVHPDQKDLIRHRSLFPGVRNIPPFKAPHMVETLYHDRKILGDCVTTLDMRIQKIVENRTGEYISRKRDMGIRNASVLVLDHHTLEVCGYLGSADFNDASIEGQVDGITARRSPGSALKPFIYALALDQGLIHSHTLLKDRPVSFGAYTPDNYLSRFKGPVFAWDALVNSRNVPAVELESEISPDLYDLLAAAGIGGLKGRGYYGLSIVLGSAELSPWELGGLYASLAAAGEFRNPVIIKNKPSFLEERNLFSPQAAEIVSAILSMNPPPGEGIRPELFPKGYSVAYKTGTSIGFKDAWAVGIYDRYVVVVWIGNFDGSGNPAFVGREAAVPLLYSICETLPRGEGRSGEGWLSDPSVSMVDVCSVSGAVPTEKCFSTVKALFIPGVSPIGSCRIHREIRISRKTGYRTDDSYEGETVSVIREVWPSDMLDLFRKAGIPRPVPPPWENELPLSVKDNPGFPPEIWSPVGGTEYIIRPGENRYSEIPLIGVADGSVKALYWFANGSFIGQSVPQKVLIWKPDPGKYDVILLDDRNRSADRTVKVIMNP